MSAVTGSTTVGAAVRSRVPTHLLSKLILSNCKVFHVPGWRTRYVTGPTLFMTVSPLWVLAASPDLSFGTLLVGHNDVVGLVALWPYGPGLMALPVQSSATFRSHV